MPMARPSARRRSLRAEPGVADLSLSLTSALKEISAEMDRQFDALLPVPNDPRADLFKAMRHAAIGGGKRLRPLLVFATARLFGVERPRTARVAMAIECIHVYSLIHDDLPAMDDDDMRRGKPTVHKLFDEATAILAGDCLHALAFDILAHEATHPDPHVRVELIADLSRAAGPHGMGGGQMIDLEAGKDQFRPADRHPVAGHENRRADFGVSRSRRDIGAGCRATSGPVCTDMPAISGWRFRLRTTSWT